MSILRKSIADITFTDLEELVSLEARETDELEFKGDLPFQANRNNPSTADRWHERGDRIGDYARDKLMAEMVAFANASGGTLVLGLEETSDEPRRAEGLNPIPNCEALARRLFDASEDVIEPRLPLLEVVPILPDAANGSGFIIMRTGRSASGPHRLSSNKEFYIRRGERAARMSVREIKEHTLELARSGDKIEETFIERRRKGGEAFAKLTKEPFKGIAPLYVRVTAVPTTPQEIEGVTRRPDLWWTGAPFTVMIDGNKPYHCSHPADTFYRNPEIRLRALASDYGSEVERLVRSDGLVEFGLPLPSHEPYGRGTTPILFRSFLISLVVAAIAQIDLVKRRLAWGSVEYALEVEVSAQGTFGFRWEDRATSSTSTTHETGNLLLPRYSLTARDSYDDVVSMVLRDCFNATGSAAATVCAVPWDVIFGEDE
ncbi:AlbA family DNA-binding domain-containing protein [Tardiphaga sp. 604_B6_N1_1]|uniref:AlbA family DNA-binding domain-containing protein n=1 Tax=unclassified Tardiphaga TaxID=2631404 RepID=UPI003F206F49